MSSDKPIRIAVAQPALIGREREYVLECLDTSWISSVGRFVSDFEAKVQTFLNVEHAMACTNGTAALHLALAAVGVGAGDEVIVPNFTYAACAHAVIHCGALPVFVDSEEESWNIAPRAFEAAITPRTRAVMVVHLYGQPAQMDAIQEIAKRHRLVIVEDAAEAIGAEYEGRRVGALGDAGVFSLFGNKIITSGEGGIVTTDRADVAERVRVLRNQGNDPVRRYWHNSVGYNYRMTNVTAAIALAQLEQADWHLNRRQEVRRWYESALSAVPGVKLQPSLPNTRHSYWMVAAELPVPTEAARDQVMALMAAENIETRPAFYLVSTMPPYRQATAAPCPVATRLAALSIVLPTHAQLTELDVQRVVQELAKALDKVALA